MTLINSFEEKGFRGLLKLMKLPINPDSITGVKTVCAACDHFGITDIRQVAYVLATVAHESGFLCIPERKAKPGTEIWEKYQRKYWDSGYYGRGYCQITWHYNYKKFGALLEMPLLTSPDLALTPETSAKILVIGMSKGYFTTQNIMVPGKKLEDYINTKKCDFVGARKIVNGTFKAAEVAAKAEKILAFLRND